MNKEVLNQACMEIEDFRDKLGETFYDEVSREDNFTYDMAKGIIAAFSWCELEVEFEAADRMLEAICGDNFESLIKKIKSRDEQGYAWESL